MRSFDLRPQLDRLVASGLGRIQRISDDVYRKLWPETVELPERHVGRFDRALCVDAFPLHPMHTAIDDQDGRRRILPLRLQPLAAYDKPHGTVFEEADVSSLLPLSDARGIPLLRYVIFWQAGERWLTESPNSAQAKFDGDECGLRLNEAIHLALQEEALVRARDIPIAQEPDPAGVISFLWWEAKDRQPTFQARFGMFQMPGGVPSRAKDVIAVSTEFEDYFLKE